MDHESFTRTYLPLADGLYRIAFHILGEREEALDAVQDCLLKLWAAEDSLDSVRDPRAWACRVMRNVCLDRVRRRKSDPVGGEVPETVPDPGGGEAATLGADLLPGQLAGLVSDLPPNQRRVLLLRVVGGRSYGDISRTTGLTEGNLRYLLSTARSTLRRRLSELGNNI